MERSPERLEILKKIDEYEKLGWFDCDVESDPPTKPLNYKKVDYTGKKLSTRIKTNIANKVARRYFDNLIQKRQLIIKDVIGMENYLAIQGGAVITCNHFNAFDNYAVYKVIQKQLGKHELYKVIREGNYTSYKGLYGYFFRHCNTLPLTSSPKGMTYFLNSFSELLKRGEKILIYPEQGMWWNYKKPRPLKEGAFAMAARNMAPVIPFFITMEDSDVIDPSNGFPVQAYTVNILPAIIPDPQKNRRENAAVMLEKNYQVWRETYEKYYNVELKY